jgi:IMP dehydrogenase
LRFEKQLTRLVKDVMTKDNLITVQGITSLQKAEIILQDYKIEKLPVTDRQGRLIGLITYKDIIKYKSRPNSCKDSLGRLRVAAAVGVTADMIDRVQALVNAGVDAVIIDTAHGHSKGVINALKNVKKTFPELDTVVGNIATADAAKALVKAGADAVKVGIGPGSICTTRVVAWCWCSSINCSHGCSRRPQNKRVPIIADGGIRFTEIFQKPLQLEHIPLWLVPYSQELKNHQEKALFMKP